MTAHVRNLPVYHKSEEIVEITRTIVDIADKDREEYELVRLMLSNAYMISAKIVGAEGGQLYRVRMECAIQAKIAACDLLAQITFCRTQRLIDKPYLNLLRTEVEAFRKLFVNWVESFDRAEDIDDGWGLFGKS